MFSKKIIFIVGPTAVGKSAVAFSLARQIEGEIISCDSMQVYKEISIASSKPTLKDRADVAHHLLDVVSVSEEFDVVRYKRLALVAMEGIFKKNKIPIIVGGSGLYMTALLDGIFEGKSKDQKFRDESEAHVREKGSEALYQQLRTMDPEAAVKIHPHDTRRIIRALEVNTIEKQPLSKINSKRQGLWGNHDIVIFALNRKRDALYASINTRVEEMFKAGIVEEVKTIRKESLSLTVKQLIGIKEILGFLDDDYDLPRAAYLIKLHTRHLAKRQLTWFRKDKRLNWIMIDEADSLRDVAQKLTGELHAKN